MVNRLQEFSDYLKSHGLKIGRSRMAIAEVILSSKHHRTPTEIYLEARKKIPSVGLVSVYRTLTLLRDAKLITESRFSHSSEPYIEPMRGRPHHDHLFCIRCSEIVEFTNDRIEQLQRSVARTHGYEITNHTLMIWGICSRCRGRTKSTKTREARVRMQIY